MIRLAVVTDRVLRISASVTLVTKERLVRISCAPKIVMAMDPASKGNVSATLIGMVKHVMYLPRLLVLRIATCTESVIRSPLRASASLVTKDRLVH